MAFLASDDITQILPRHLQQTESQSLRSPLTGVFIRSDDVGRRKRSATLRRESEIFRVNPIGPLSCNRMKTLRTLLLLFAMFKADRRTRPREPWGNNP